MSEQTPTQILPPEAPTQEQPTAEQPTTRFDPTVTLDFSEEMLNRAVGQAEKTKTLFRRIEADAELRGYEDIRGLNLRLDSGERLKVIDANTQPVYEPIERTRRTLPRFKGKLFKMTRDETGKRHLDVSDALEFRTEQTIYRKTGMPHLVKRGSEVSFERREKRIEPKDKKFVTVETYDDEGHLVTTQTERLSEFYIRAGAGMEAKATWDWKEREPKEAADPSKELAIGLSRNGKAVFEDVTEHLEERGITNWVGLTWNLVTPSKLNKQGKDESIQGTDQRKEGVPVKERIQEIIHDKTVRERNYTGKGYRYDRHYIIRTTEVYADGDRVVKDGDPLRDFELWHYFEKPEDFEMPHESSIWNMRMPNGDIAPYENEPLVAEGLRRNDATFIADKYGDLNHDKRRPVLGEALGMLSTRDAYPINAEGLEILNQTIANMMANESERKLGEELQAVLQEVGYDYFEAAVRKIYESVYPTIEHDAARLGLSMKKLDREDDLNWVIQVPEDEKKWPIDRNRWADDSDRWIVRSLLAKSRQNREAGKQDAFGSVLQTPLLLRSMIDEHVGEMFGRATVKSEEVPEQDGFDEENKPKIKRKTVYGFNDDLIETLPILGSPANMKKIKTWRDKVWGAIDTQAHKVYDQLVEQEESGDSEVLDPQLAMDYEDIQKLGRMLRRTIGE